MAPASENALIVQSDGSVLLDAQAPRAAEARATLAPFAELVKSPEHVHTYRLTPLSIRNARAAGLAAEQMVEALREHARYAVPPNVEQEILELAARYGRVIITRDGDALRCTCRDWTTAEPTASMQRAFASTPLCGGCSNRVWSRPGFPRRTGPVTWPASPSTGVA